MKSRVAIFHNDDIGRAVGGALGLIYDLKELIEGKHVAIKPNDTTARPNDLTPCTQADTVRAVIKEVKGFNPRRITVTGGSGAGETDQIFKLLGIDKVIKEEGVEFFDHNRPPFQSVPLDYGPQKEVMVNPHIFEYEVLISLAQHKVHSMATVTLTMKNIAMSFPAADYYGHTRERMLHPHGFFDDLQGFIAGMCKRFPISLGIVNGHPAMVGRGPVGGTTFDSGLIIASKDFVAADFIGTRLLGIDHVEHISQAAKLGLGKANLDDIEITGVPLDEAKRIMTERRNKAERKIA